MVVTITVFYTRRQPQSTFADKRNPIHLHSSPQFTNNLLPIKTHTIALKTHPHHIPSQILKEMQNSHCMARWSISSWFYIISYFTSLKISNKLINANNLFKKISNKLINANHLHWSHLLFFLHTKHAFVEEIAAFTFVEKSPIS